MNMRLDGKRLEDALSSCGAAAVVSACMLAGIMLNYIVVDFSKIADKIGLPDLSFAGSVIGFFSGRDNSITMSGLVLLRNLFNGTGSQFPQGMDSLLRICMILVGVPYLICAVTLVLSFLRRTWSYIVTIVLACAGECAVIGGLVLILPKAISSHIHSLIDVSLVPEKTIRTVLFEGAGPAWWIMAAGFVLLIIISAVGIPGGAKKQAAEKAPPEPPAGGAAEDGQPETGFICEFGPLDGVQIPLMPDEAIRIGSDPQRCQVVVQDPGVEAVHCELRWNGILNLYEIRDESDSGVYLMGKKVGRDMHAQAGHGDVLCLGDGSRRIYLI